MITNVHAQSAPPTQAPGFYRFRIGSMLVTTLNDGFALRPVEGFIRNAPGEEVRATIRAAFLPTDAFQNPFNGLAIEHDGRLIVVDPGNGDMGAPATGAWMRNFRAAGLDPARVTHVLISHFHGDHINGVMLRDGTAVFPNAEVIVPAAEWDFWMSKERFEEAPEAIRGTFQNVARVFGPIADRVRRVAAEAEALPGITARAAYGHSPGHTLYELASGEGRLVYLADTTTHPALGVTHPAYASIFDMDAEAARLTRLRVLGQMADQRIQVAMYHAPFPATGHVARDGDGFRFVPIQWSAAI